MTFHGRGFVQLTGRSNYARAGAALGLDLLAKPDLALEPAHTAAIMVRGMEEGWFTGKKLADYFGPGRDDPEGARRIINGTDRAETIAGYHRTFLAALKAGGVGVVTTAPQTPPKPPDVVTSALQPAPQPALTGGLFRVLAPALRRAFPKES